MARVNDGNLLQHFTECALAEALVEGTVGLRLVATHAMAPHEPAQRDAIHDHNRHMRALLDNAAEDAGAAVLRGYARTHASVARYPNTAALLAALFGERRLSGVLCEVAPEARFALEEAWRGTDVRIEGRDWREAAAAGALFPPDGLDRPWLVTMDPYTWRLDGEAKKEARGPDLLRPDLELMRPVFAAHVKSGQPGAVSLFAYGLDAPHAKSMRTNALRMADRLGLERAVLGVAAADGRRHLGVVMTSVPDLAAETAEAWHDFIAS